jgi:chromate transporter
MAQETDTPTLPTRTGIGGIFWQFLVVGLTAYGGPAMMPALRDRVVRKLGWLGGEEFRLGLGLCQSLPGGTLMQLSAWVGLKRAGLAGALAAYAGFSVPSFALVTLLTLFYSYSRSLPLAVSVFTGLKVVVLAICLMACIDFIKRFAPTTRHMAVTAGAAALFLGGAGVVPIIGGAALCGMLFLDPGPGILLGSIGPPPRSLPLALGLAGLDILLLGWLFYADRQLFDLSISMMKVDMLAFGGFGVIPVMFREWLSCTLDGRTHLSRGMALAQVTPGPTMLASAFVGYWVRGVIGAVVASIAIFACSFIIVLAAAQYRDAIIASKLARKALSGVLATLGGMIVVVSVTLALAVHWGGSGNRARCCP